jgi:hypothetical protein
LSDIFVVTQNGLQHGKSSCITLEAATRRHGESSHHLSTQLAASAGDRLTPIGRGRTECESTVKGVSVLKLASRLVGEVVCDQVTTRLSSFFLSFSTTFYSSENNYLLVKSFSASLLVAFWAPMLLKWPSVVISGDLYFLFLGLANATQRSPCSTQHKP